MALAKAYDPKLYEADIYKLWEDSGLFAPSGHGEPYSIILPPPNATGQLHLGHVIMVALEDCLIRYQRMRGRSALWLPGTDHAAIATNAVIERELDDEGKTKHDIGREPFLKRLGEYVENSRGTIRAQVRAMGASLDWSRERYTMEPAMNRVVSEVFIKMYNDGLIYRGHRIVNWDPKLETTVSDDELDRKEEQTTFYTFRYGPFEIGTARPETKFGDKYVVMHPDDKRYANYKHGQTFEADWLNGKVKATVIKDDAVDPKFGTGVMTITPWHDALDFEIAERHQLEKEQIIGLDGKLLPVAGEFAGTPIEEARPKVVEKLRAKGLLVGEKADYTHNIALNSRGGGVIEPQIMLQWFIDVNKPAVSWKGRHRSLKEVMRMVVEDGDVRILPARFNKTYYYWIDNLRDWCVSRQIWWGHRIPAWYKPVPGDRSQESGASAKRKKLAPNSELPTPAESTDEVYVGHEPPQDKKSKAEWKQDEDTLDTWFSSAMWTWSTLIDRELAGSGRYDLAHLLKHSPDFHRFHPTNMLETGYDILFFWVARMILMTTYATGQVPFRDVYLHGLVRTRDGRKMSKSHPDTVIDPLEVIPKYGADALRLAMTVGQSPGSDIRLYDEKIAGQRNFCNKLWNVARFVIAGLPEGYRPSPPKPASVAEHWINARLQKAVEQVSRQLDGYRFSDAAHTVYRLLWDDFADWYVEVAKKQPNADVLVYGLETILKLSHPFVPFVSEAVWQQLPHRKSLLMGETWPEPQKVSPKDAAEFEEVKSMISEIRNITTELQLGESRLYHKGSDLLRRHGDIVTALSGVKEVQEVEAGHGLHLTTTRDESWLDIEEQVARSHLFRLIQRREQQLDYVTQLGKRLENKAYLKNAPRELVEQSRRSLDEAKTQMKKLNEQIESLERELRLYG
jgi:valyl-tRNA synthetase